MRVVLQWPHMADDKKPPRLQNTALAVTRWVGSVQSILIHTLAFTMSFGLVWSGIVSFDRMLLVLTTLVSLEAIYLAIFIQMTINVQQQSLEEVEQNIDEIQEDIDEIQEDVEEMQEDVEEISEDTHEDEVRDVREEKTLKEMHEALMQLMRDVEKLQQKQ